MRQWAERAGIQPGQMVLTGHVTDEELGALYHACKLFVFASFYEGSGLPILEAMSCGAPGARQQDGHRPRDPRRAARAPSTHSTVVDRRLHRGGPRARPRCSSGWPRAHAAAPACTRGSTWRERTVEGYEQPATRPRPASATAGGAGDALAAGAVRASPTTAIGWRASSAHAIDVDVVVADPLSSLRRAAGGGRDADRGGVVHPATTRASTTASCTAWATRASTATSMSCCGCDPARSSPTTYASPASTAGSPGWSERATRPGVCAERIKALYGRASRSRR